MIVSINSKNNERYINRFKEASKDLQEYFFNLYNTYADIKGTEEEQVLKNFLIKIEPNIVNKINDVSNDDGIYSSIDNITLSNYPTVLEPIFKNIYTEDDSNRLITTLNDYFCYITDLTKTLKLNKYFILPLDEEPLMIDADARTIVIPSSIKKNGLAVQGDDRAEMVHFEVDRYFDNIDLGSPNIKIYIQYETTYTFPKGYENYSDEQKAEMEFYKQGFVPEAFREIVYDQDGIEKVVFGWLLDKYITKTPGTIKFAVHFLQGDLNEDTLTNITYKLSTLTVQSTINKTLPTENIKIYPVKNPSQLIRERLVDSVFNEESPQPDKPEFYNNLGEGKFSSNTEPSYKYNYFDIEQEEVIDGVKYENNKIELSVYAGSDDTGSISYGWKKISNNNIDSISLNSHQIKLMKTEDEELIEKKAYYDKNGNYIFYPALEKKENLYDKKSYCEVEPDNGSFVGKYYAIAYNRLGQKEPGKMESNRIIVPGPDQPIVKNTETYYHILKNINGTLINETNENVNGFVIEAEVGDLPYEGAVKDKLTYQWQKSSIENSESVSDIEIIKAGAWDTSGVITEEYEYAPQDFGWYTVKVIANRNGGVNEQNSNVFYRYTELPDELLLDKEKPEMYNYKPVIQPEENDFDNYYILDDEGIYIKAKDKEEYNEEADYYFERVENEEKVYISDGPLEVEANTKDKKSDNYIIEWYRKDGTPIENVPGDGTEVPEDILKEDGIFGNHIYCKVINKYNGVEVKGPESCFFDINE